MPDSRLVLPILLLAACGGGGTTIVNPPPPPPPANFVLTLRPDVEDQASAQALGWGTVVPDVDVTLTPKDPALGAPQSHRATAAGTVTLAQLAAGVYVVEAKRWLSEAERGRLPAGDDAIGFVAKAYVRAEVGGGPANVSVPASRRRSLVISEFFNHYSQPNPAVEAYTENAFIELHNNADTTIYLDGMIIARGMNSSYDFPLFPCSLYKPGLGFDPAGVWARWMAKFPGAGRDYPVPPGGTVVVATDAIDHSVIVPGGLDLRSAQFEMIGTADVDNPVVPNMIDISEGGSLLQHGMDWGGDLNAAVSVLVLPTPTSTLPRSQVPGPSGNIFLRLPRERIIDVLSFHGTYVAPYPACPDMVHTNFDRAMATLFVGDEFTLSGHRRLGLVLPGGRKVLQHSRSSDADFMVAPRSPGVLP